MVVVATNSQDGCVVCPGGCCNQLWLFLFLSQAYFEQEKNLGDEDVLLSCAAEVRVHTCRFLVSVPLVYNL